MTYTPSENSLLGQAIGDKSTTAKHSLGHLVRAKDSAYGVGEFIYLQGVASCALGSWVTYNADDGSTTLLAANAIGPVAIAMAATTASYYGWFQISGKAIGRALTGYADNARVWTTATAGVVDDASVAGNGVQIAKGASAIHTPSIGLAEFEIHRPFVNAKTSFS